MLIRAEELKDGNIICYDNEKSWQVKSINMVSTSYIRVKLHPFINGVVNKLHIVEHDYGRASKLNISN